ncbi:sugar ABC transporter permease [Yersinia frederiksenii]|nr:sugar ABC transporter permease [Yersinia frederiksenii]
MATFSYSMPSLINSLFKNLPLIGSLTKREIIGRYQGSVLGLLWSFFNPIFMLIVYTFVFSVIFKAKWNAPTGSNSEFGLVLFSGLLVFNFFAECINRSPTIIINNVNYVKKVIFPLEIFPWVIIGSSLVHMVISIIVWVVAYLFILNIFPPVTFLMIPIVLVPLVLIVMGLSWFLASLGVYLRDVSQIMTILTTVIMFLSPIFYPASALPEKYQGLLSLNPLNPTIEMMRDIMLWGKVPEWNVLGGQYIISIFVVWLGFAWFQKTRKGFADVL